MTSAPQPPDWKDLPARDRLLQTAHTLFYRDGIRATGIDRVIAESGVTKVTFYRHFPSKNDLVCAYLEYRHTHWTDWFAAALSRHGGASGDPARRLAALTATLSEWLGRDDYRGCAFINGVGELADTVPEVVEIARRHKRDVTDLLATLLPPTPERQRDAQALTLVVDGAIVRAQMGESVEDVLSSVVRLLRGMAAFQGA
ncbi:transcriptional regulator, TetR family [Acidovorax delafieldii 2AN]|uniref:Transcriptional regulator, TetR family n=1 Tax=Acidovorax delafieldii 2AN TaxID=573060 RepID=C5T8N1_ACIDE|nr:TetR/AcrR family transcriptional regulator [Acidovorax delafieldii]EER59170.1 transcriptional regulator, TetR family [Acidovorax delafieldii 2AN]